MSRFVLDDHLSEHEVHDRIRRWSIAQYLREVRPRQVIKDERVPMVLQELRTPTFITIDDRFQGRSWCHRRYCILFFALRLDEQKEILPLLRRLLRLPEFRTRAARMGKVARVSREGVRWWQIGDDSEHAVHWRRLSRRIER